MTTAKDIIRDHMHSLLKKVKEPIDDLDSENANCLIEDTIDECVEELKSRLFE